VSRSYKKEPYESCESGSFKAWKQCCNQTYRHECKIKINTCDDWDALVLPLFRKKFDIWDSPKDGRMHREEVPALNQCEVDSQKYKCAGFRLSSSLVELKDGHKISCNCYTNKKSWYWKMMRK
jgi:hypothetical protein